MKGRRRTMVFIGATIIEVGLAKLFGLGFAEGVSMVIIGNLIVAQYADMVYKNKIFKR